MRNLLTTERFPEGAFGARTSKRCFYDANKRKLEERDLRDALATQVFSYDQADRLTAWNSDAGSETRDWTLTLVGDWDQVTRNGQVEDRAHSDVHEVTQVGNALLTYDFKGNLATNPTRNAVYVWDDENRMRTSSDTQSGDTTQYRYDAMGRRVALATNGQQTVYVCAGSQVVSEYINGVESQHYVYGTYVDDPIALIKPTGDTYYYHSNHLFSVEAITDGNGDLVETYTYDAYGALEIHDSLGQSQGAVSTIGNAYGFTGRRLDQASGLWYFRARYYDDLLGRFIGRNPMGFADGLSLYLGLMGMKGLLDPTGMPGAL